MRGTNKFFRLGMIALGLSALVLIQTPVGASTTWNIGDVFVGVAGGSYQVYDNAGAYKETITDGMGGFTTGCAFNPSLTKLYATNFSNTKVVVYDDASPHAISQVVDTAVTSSASSESIVFAANGDFYVGNANGNQDVLRYDAAGVFQAGYDVAPEARGSDWIDLAADQTTLFYTSEGRQIKRFDVGTNTQLADFALLPGSGVAYALRLLPPGDGSGGLLVADTFEIRRLDGAGSVVQTYDVGGEDSWFALNLDPNGTSFWSGNYDSANFYRFDIATGAVEVGPVNTGTGPSTLFGICVKGELTAAIPEIRLDPPSDQNQSGTAHTVTATVTQGGNPVPGEQVTFAVTAGPNTGERSGPGECATDPSCLTDANGQTSWTYVGQGTGTDTIEACFTDDAGREHCAEASKEWLALTVGIDIKPYSFPNSIRLSSAGNVAVAILTGGGFDATTVDPSSVCFGDAGDPAQRDCTEVHTKGHISDADGDGDLDLVLHYETAQTGIDLGDTTACLTGFTFGGSAIQGCDSIRPLP